MANAGGSDAAAELDAIRARIDQIDNDLLALIAARLACADAIGPVKNAGGEAAPMRPAREIAILRRLIGAADARTPSALVVEIWRTLIAANILRQGGIEVVIGGGSEPLAMYDLARRHFGGQTRLTRVADPQTALLKAIENKRVVAVAPWPAAAGVGGWWPALSESRFSRVHLVGALPVLAHGSDTPEAGLFAALAPEPAEGDASLIVAFDPHHRMARALAEAQLVGRELARSEPRVLLGVEGYIAAGDVRLAVLSRAGLEGVRVVGAYARVQIGAEPV